MGWWAPLGLAAAGRGSVGGWRSSVGASLVVSDVSEAGDYLGGT